MTQLCLPFSGRASKGSFLNEFLKTPLRQDAVLITSNFLETSSSSSFPASKCLFDILTFFSYFSHIKIHFFFFQIVFISSNMMEMIQTLVIILTLV